MRTTTVPYQTATLCLRIVAKNGTTIRVTHHPKNLLMTNGTLYLSGSGYEFTGYEALSSFSPSAIDLEGLLGYAGVTRDAVASGVFDGARAYLFRTSFLSPVEDEDPLLASFLGKATLTDDGYRFEDMALTDALNQSVGDSYSPMCGKPFGGQEYAGCKIDLAPLKVVGALTHVTSGLVFADALRSEAADWFGAGKIRFISGLNAGLRAMEIKRHEFGGEIEIFEPLFAMPQVGDAYEMWPGCRKRKTDCQTKWANYPNFGGFPDMPTSSVYGEIGTK